MANGTIQNGDYTEEDDSSGNYVLKDPNGNTIFEWDNANSEWGFGDNPLAGISAVNGIKYATPGELQTTLSSATAGDYVVLEPGADYDPGSETTIPERASLDFNGAVFRPQSSYDGFFLEGGANIYNGRAELRDVQDWDGRLISLDGARYGGHYRRIDKTDVHVEMEARSTFGTTAGTLLYLKSDGGSQTINLGNYFDIQVSDIGVGVDAVTNNGSPGGYINGVVFDGMLMNCETAIQHRNTAGSAAAFSSIFRGDIQTGSQTLYGIRNQTAEDSINLWGTIWDPGTGVSGEVALAGPNITVLDYLTAGKYQGLTDESSNQIVYALRDGAFQTFDGENDDLYEWSPTAQGLYLDINGTTRWQFNDDGLFRPFGGNPANGSLYIPEFDTESNAPNGTLFYDASASDLKYKTPGGTVLAGGFA